MSCVVPPEGVFKTCTEFHGELDQKMEYRLLSSPIKSILEFGGLLAGVLIMTVLGRPLLMCCRKASMHFRASKLASFRACERRKKSILGPNSLMIAPLTIMRIVTATSISTMVRPRRFFWM